MRRLRMAAALAAALLLVAAALPAGAAPPTAEIVADCGDVGAVTFDFIVGDGSLAGFVDGEVVVIHELDVSLTTVLTLGGGSVYTIVQDFPPFLAGSQGLDGLTMCEFGTTELSDEDLGPLTKALVKQAGIFFGVDLSDEALGQSVSLRDTTEGIVWVQFPRGIPD